MENRILFFICIIMKSKTIRFLSFLFPCLLACSIGHAYEQDNWYLANEWNSVSNSRGVAYYEDNTTGTKQIYVTNTSSDNIKVYDLNGSLARTITIASNRNDPYNLCLDANGTIYIGERYAITCLDNDGTFRWRTGKNASISNVGTSGSGNGEFDYATGITLGPDENLYVADKRNERIQVLDKNGTFVREFGSGGTAPGQLDQPISLSFLPDGNLVIRDERKLHWFQADGSFVRRIRENDNDLSSGRLATSRSGEMITYISRLHTTGSNVYDVYVLDAHGSTIARLTNSSYSTYESGWHYCFTPNGDIIVSTGSKIQVHKRAFRTKGMPVPNVIPQPAIRSVSQRAGTNILDLDFEIIDSDDATATVGILAYAEGTRILPQAWTDGTESKIGVPIATNQVHRVSWDVKQDWTNSTGEIKFEILCQDANRTMPVDLHFLTLPFPDGNLTISRSPLKDSDFANYAKYLISTNENGISMSVTGTITEEGDNPPADCIEYLFSTCGAKGKSGPTWAEVNATYIGTNLEDKISMESQGIQLWSVPTSGSYLIECVGARGGSQNKSGGAGAYANGKFSLIEGEVLKVLVGQTGLDNSSYSVGGGGGSFVVKSDGSPLVIAGGGGGGANNHKGFDGREDSTGGNGYKKLYIDQTSNSGLGGTDGTGGLDHHSSRGGAGLLTNGGGGAKSFTNGGIGGSGSNNGKDGGFGGGGGSYSRDGGGGGGGYSGGGGGGGSGDGSGGGGGSYSYDSNATIIAGYNSDHGAVKIVFLPNDEGHFISFQQTLLDHKNFAANQIRQKLINSLGNGYRYSTENELTKAKEAATPGSINKWTAIRPIQPRNLPTKVNEYGFDSYDHGNRAWWVVKE